MKRLITGGVLASLFLFAGVAQADATLNLTAPSTINVRVGSLLPSSPEGVALDNGAVTAALSGAISFPVRLTNTGDSDSVAARINPINAGSHIQLWALAPD